jgi:N,N'-diacetyllegionaminate synthase
MKIGTHDTDQKVLIIAEIGNNHEGDFNIACEMIEAAAEAGADAVKFQTIVPNRLVGESDIKRFRQLTRFAFSPQQFRELHELALKNSVMFLSTPFDIEVIDWLDDLVPAYKIASGDNDFLPLLDRVSQTGKPILISLGLGKIKELHEIRKFLQKKWDSYDFGNPGIGFLHCVVSYPTPYNQAYLKNISKIKSEKVTAGYSDHTLGIKAVELAVANGARIIEKHFTLDKNLSEFRDHQLSADPDDLKGLVESIRQAEELLGTDKSDFQECEKPNEFAVRRSIATIRNMESGEIVSKGDLCWLRPRNGFRPGEEDLVVGRKLVAPIKEGESFNPSHFGS